MPRVGAGGTQRRGGADATSATGARLPLPLTRWLHPKLLESVACVLTYEPVHPLNVMAQHLHYAPALLSVPQGRVRSTSSPITPEAIMSSLSSNPVRCFTHAHFLREHLAPHGVDALRTAALPGWCGAPCEASSGTGRGPEVSLEHKGSLLRVQHSTIVALLRDQGRLSFSERVFAAASEAASQNPVSPLFFSGENEVAGATVAAFCVAWVEQELQLELPSSLVPTVALAVSLVILLQLRDASSREHVGETLRAVTSHASANSASLDSLSMLPTVCAWVAVLSPSQGTQLYAYLYCCVSRRGKVRAPLLGHQADPSVCEAHRNLVNAINQVAALFDQASDGVEWCAVDSASLHALLANTTLMIASVVHVAVPLCHWVSSDGLDSPCDAEGRMTGGQALSPSSTSSAFLGEAVPQLAAALHGFVAGAHTPPSSASGVTASAAALPGSMAGFDLLASLPHLVHLRAAVSPASSQEAPGPRGCDDTQHARSSLSRLVSHATATAALVAPLPLPLEEVWKWICLCFAATWEDVIVLDAPHTRAFSEKQDVQPSSLF